MPDGPRSTADAPTTRGAAARMPAFEGAELHLLVIGDGMSVPHRLPPEGEVVIGRGDQADVRIEEPSISRRHARLRIGEVITIEDLDSANGTAVHGERLPPGRRVEVHRGVAIELGTTVVLLQGGPAAERAPRPRGQSGRLRRIGTHDYFEVRLEEECAQAEASRGAFAVLRIHLEDPMGETAIQELLGEALRPTDPLAQYGPGEYEVLLLRTGRGAAERIVEALVERFASRDARVRIGMASYPQDGRSPEALLRRANEGASGPTEDDGEVVILDRVMVRLHKLIERVAAGQINVLLLGETGVGKEVLAHAVHTHSPRAARPFVKLNGAALTESLFESELFGHEKGAFTGAVATKRGLIEAADGGTFFLDEVGELPLSIQAKLLTVIEDRQVMRVGALEPRSIDVRFVAATNRDLEAEVARGHFRQDLFYRLNGISLVIPPLRERTAEIERLARHFASQGARQIGLDRPPTLSDEALDLMLRYRWPGNIRELRNVVERAVLLCLGETIEPEHLPLDKMRAVVVEPSNRAPIPTPSAPDGRRPVSAPLWAPEPPLHAVPEEHTAPLEAPLSRRRTVPIEPIRRRGVPDEGSRAWHEERQKYVSALEACAGNQGEAARRLGVSRRTLVSRLVDYRIPRPRASLPDED